MSHPLVEVSPCEFSQLCSRSIAELELRQLSAEHDRDGEAAARVASQQRRIGAFLEMRATQPRDAVILMPQDLLDETTRLSEAWIGG